MNTKEEFMEIFSAIRRPGADKLLAYLTGSDFFTAPASTKYHGAVEGGLLEHSLNVYSILKSKAETDPMWKDRLAGVSQETIAIVALLHDICKTNFYDVEMKNRKVDGMWVQQPEWVCRDKFPIGHGEKSVIMILRYMQLTDEEIYAIRWHMGPYSGDKDWQNISAAFSQCPLALALFESDMEATYLCESR